MNMFRKYFSYVFVDEAGQATEPDAIIPLTLLSSSDLEGKGRFHGQIVLAGDPQQLGPVIFSPIAKKILGKSILERLLNVEPYKIDVNTKTFNPKYITKLLKNYRSHPSLIQISNELFYDNELIACADASVYKFIGWDELPNRSFPMIFHEVKKGIETKRNEFSTSPYNIAEIDTALSYVDKLVGTKLGNVIIQQKDIGIVTPFIVQKLMLRAGLQENGFKDIEVGTVQLFQGKEKEIIIVTTVRSEAILSKSNTNSTTNKLSHLGFLSDRKRFNVAITRAKSLLIVIGHPVLDIDFCWKKLITFCKNNGSYIDLDFTSKDDMEGGQNKIKILKANDNVVEDARCYEVNVDTNPKPSYSQVCNKIRESRDVIVENVETINSNLTQNMASVRVGNIFMRNTDNNITLQIQFTSAENISSDESEYHSCDDE